MALVTGSPFGTLETAEELYLNKAPYIYFQDYNAAPFYNPDSEGFYWQMTGTATYNVFPIGCPFDVSLSDDVTMNDMRCDNVGVKDTAQQRNFVELGFTMSSLFPPQVLRHILHGGAVTESTVNHTQKFGLGAINNDQFWMVYAPLVYNEEVGDYIAIHIHKAKFVNSFNIAMTHGTNWALGVKLRAYADTTKPSTQQFLNWIRSDASVIV